VVQPAQCASIDIREQASDNLHFIRSAMARAGASSVSGAGTMAMGLVALSAMSLAATATDPADELLVWIGAAPAALAAGTLGSWLKARRNGLLLFGDPGRRFLLCLIPTLLIGVVITLVLWQTDEMPLLPGLWMMLYGAGVLSAGTYAVPPVMHMGVAFLLAGLVTLVAPPLWSNVLLGAAFGAVHLGFGHQVYRHHGG
jgi:hypothetical protein